MMMMMLFFVNKIKLINFNFLISFDFPDPLKYNQNYPTNKYFIFYFIDTNKFHLKIK